MPLHPLRVVLEVGKKRVFASALDWPGWSRSGKTEEQALETLLAYAPRYAVVAEAAGVPFDPDDFGQPEIVERLPGSGGTDVGAPGARASSDSNRFAGEQAASQLALLEACWTVFDRVAAGAPAALRKGPRGGGRDRDKVIDHVVSCDAGYASRLGVKRRQPAIADRAAIAELREAVLAALRSAEDGQPLKERGWPPRFAVRYIAWHALDHAWEIEDKSEPAPAT
jgi:hypothetical protein